MSVRSADGNGGPSVTVPALSAAGDGGGIVAGLGAKQLAVAALVGGAALMVVVGAVAGAYVFVLSDGSDPDLQLVPAGSDAVSYVNVDQATSDRAIRKVANTWFELEAGGADSMDEALADFENETGLDPEKLHHATAFSRYQESTGAGAGDYSATILRTDWEASALVAASEDEGVTFEERSYRGHTLYAPSDDSLTGESWIAVLGDGTFVLGTEQATKDVVDVSEGEMDALDGELRDAFDATRDGYVRFATRVPEEQVPTEGTTVDTGEYRDVQLVSGAYYAKANALGLEMTMHARNESTAEDIKDVTKGSKQMLSGGIQNETVQETLRDVEVTRDGTAVTISYENSVDSIQGVLRALDESGDEEGSQASLGSGPALAAERTADLTGGTAGP